MRTILAVVTAVLLGIGGAFILPEVSAQVACTQDSQCSSLGPEFRCVSNRCNLPPPIWNLAPGAISGGQTGSFDVSGASQVRGNFTVGSGFAFPVGAPLGSFITAGDVYTNALYSRTTGADNIWLGDTNDTVQIQGALTVSGVTINGNLGVAGNITLTTPGATVDGVNLDLAFTGLTTSGGGLAITGAGNSRNVALISTCTDGQILKWSTVTSSWACSTDVAGVGGAVSWTQLADFPAACAAGEYVTAVGGTLTCSTPAAGGGPETDPVYSAWYNSGNPTITGTVTVNGNITLPTAGATVDGVNLDNVVLTTASYANPAWLTSLGWNKLTGYPAACPVGQFVTAVGGALTCAAPPPAEASGIAGSGAAGQVAFWSDPTTLTSNVQLIFDNAGAAFLRITDTTQNPELQVKYGSGASDHWAFYVDNFTDTLRLWGAGATGNDRIAVDTTGRVGIGTETPTQLLDVAGNIRSTGNILLPTANATVDGVNLDNVVLTTASYANPAWLTSLGWNKLTGYPAACPVGQFVTAVGGVLTCDVPSGGAGTVSGTGSTARLAKFTGASIIGDSILTEIDGTISVEGSITATGCFGPIFRQGSGSAVNGNRGGYRAAVCPADMHICQTDEILNSVSCGVAVPASGSYWVLEGPPGYTATANDCRGLTSAAAGDLGTYWDFAQGDGGVGWMTPCSSTLQFACCS